jgi:hypothetical protein
VRLGIASLLAASVLLASGAWAEDFYVSPTGTADTGAGTGTITNPWNLQTALSQPAAVNPGDTIWLRGGTYVGRFTSYLSGSTSQPIVVRSFKGEWARIDGGPGPLVATLTISGHHTWFWGFEIFSSSATRRSAQNGSAPTDLNRGSPIFVAQDASHPGIRIINMVLHEGTDGLSAFATAPDMEIYGNLIYNNGWDGATDRGHGHGLYLQNQTGTKKVSDNIVFNNYANGVNIYGSSNAFLDNIELTGNTVFNAGVLSSFGSALNLLFGGGRVADHGTVRSNNLSSGGVAFGYGAGTSNFVIQDNFFGGPDGPDFNQKHENLTMTGNRFYDDPWNPPGTSGPVTPRGYPSNTYYRGVRPTGTFVFVRPNNYEAGRANITVFNWDRNATVSVDLSGILTPGADYEVRNAQDFFGPPVLSGLYAGGSLTLPMTGLSVSPPIGGTAPAPTGPDLNVFVVLSRPGVTGKRSATPVLGPPAVRRPPTPH